MQCSYNVGRSMNRASFNEIHDKGPRLSLMKSYLMTKRAALLINEEPVIKAHGNLRSCQVCVTQSASHRPVEACSKSLQSLRSNLLHPRPPGKSQIFSRMVPASSTMRGCGEYRSMRCRGRSRSRASHIPDHELLANPSQWPHSAVVLFADMSVSVWNASGGE